MKTILSSEKAFIIRTERGLTIAGTRITLYDVIDLIKAQYPPKLIRDKFNLTDEQISAALSYIETHHTQVEAEYQEVLQTREEIYQYWEERNREHFAKMAAKPQKPEKQALWAKLEEQKAQRTDIKYMKSELM
ncbi:MAG: DUF433 domain-containing protein [Nostocales cyanobacterium LE14-WE4]|jgi:uncharacterized protein (DUF433 family)|nr:DUF433 domain-containing protein [Anabaena sp. 49633_E8]MCE2700116.1 DUF433 domain-containing protein [Anabaena sp. 49633_E8]MDJ0499304.1 DUF433 domain-containing protein [Nostocales cyanobacterium LE14-WE4]